ncbi:uncharacterized protein [Nicotiana sylvestris]|uniref:uncharacterized protein n=1 Tax=Nicotiana sylvestris TaxID=4096 RepID=UPI00388C8B07
MADLIELEMVDFDVIMGMDWLYSCFAKLDYRTRVMRLEFPNKPAIEWKGNGVLPKDEGKVMVRNGAELSLVAEVKEKELIDPTLAQMKESVLNNKTSTFSLSGNWDDHLLLIEFAYNNSFHVSIQMAPFEALYGRRCRSPIGWFEVSEAELLGPDLVHQAMEKVKIIQESLKAAQSRQKSYAEIRRRKLEFQVDDWVFLRVSPMKGVMRFGKKGKLSPRYVGSYRVTQRIGQVAYRLELPPEMSLVHPVFHVSMLKKVVGDRSTIVPIEDIEVNEELSYEEIPVAILDRQVRKLRNKEVASVKVLWKSQQV